MIPKVTRGHKIGGLIRYLMGPGRFNEHTEQRVVASWDGAPELHQPPLIAPEGREGGAAKFDVTDLVARLSEPAKVGGIPLVDPPKPAEGKKTPQGPVWHCSLRNHAEDRVLSDAEWARVVADVLDATGIAPHGDVGACRWVAIRHAEDHVHIAAVLVRQDTGKRFYPFRDWPQTRKVVRAAEVRLGITRTEEADRTAIRQSTRAEMEKAVRRGAAETTRAWLRRAARLAAVQAQDPEEFFRRLRDLEIRIRARLSASGEIEGYALGWRHDLNAEGKPVWFSGGSLAHDLTMPKLKARWASAEKSPVIAPAASELSRVGAAERSAAIVEARSAMDHATAAVAAGDHTEAPGIAHAAEDMLIVLTMLTSGIDEPAPRMGPADIYQRAARSPGVGQPVRWGPIAVQLRAAAWRLAAVGTLGRRGNDGSGAELMLAVAVLIAEIAAWQEQSRRLAQARAARATYHALSSRPPGHPDASRGPGPQVRRERARDSGLARRQDGNGRATQPGPGPVVRRGRGPSQSRGLRQ